jgi:hypothetical protein
MEIVLGTIILVLILVIAMLSADCRRSREVAREAYGKIDMLREDVAKSDAWVQEHKHIIDAYDPTRRHTDQDVANLFARTRHAMHAHWRRDEPKAPKKPRVDDDEETKATYAIEKAAYDELMVPWSARVDSERLGFAPYDDAVTSTYLAWLDERPAPEVAPEEPLDATVTQQALDMVGAQLAGRDWHV